MSILGLVPMAAASGDIAAYLLDLFVLLLAARVGEELFRHLHQPVVAGQILAGVVVGPSILGFVELSEVVEVFAELGVIFLLFWVGLETRISDIASVGKAASLVGVLGVVLPVGAGVGFSLAFGANTETALFVGAALAATSVGITSALLVELGMQSGAAVRTILGAAVIDDILALIALAMATGIATTGSVGATDLLILLGLAFGFLAFAGLGGSRLMQRWPQLLEAPRSVDSPLMISVLICLGLAVLSAEIGLAAVIGAFLAGMIVSETRDHNTIETEVAPLYAFFAPFFFATIGVQVVLGSFAETETLLLLFGLTALAIVTKYAGAWLGTFGMNRTDRRVIAAGMVPRGEVGIIVAGIGFAEGVIDADLFAVVVGMAVLTTLVAPYMIKAAGRRVSDA